MGSYIEFNDTLQITTEQGFPADILNLEKHRSSTIPLEGVKDKVFEFRNKPGARIYHPSPNRCFLVHNIDGKWLYWRKIITIEQTISETEQEHVTSDKYRVTELYDPEYQEQVTRRETRPVESYF